MWAGCCCTDKYCQTYNPNNSEFRIYRKAWQQLQTHFSSSRKLLCSENRNINMCMEVTFCRSARAEICKMTFSKDSVPDHLLYTSTWNPGCLSQCLQTSKGSENQGVQTQTSKVGHPWRDWKAGDLRDLNISKDSRATGRNKQSLFITQVLCRNNSKGDAFGGIFLTEN